MPLWNSSNTSNNWAYDKQHEKWNSVRSSERNKMKQKHNPHREREHWNDDWGAWGPEKYQN